MIVPAHCQTTARLKTGAAKPLPLINAEDRPLIPYREATAPVISWTPVILPFFPDANSMVDMDDNCTFYHLHLAETQLLLPNLE